MTKPKFVHKLHEFEVMTDDHSAGLLFVTQLQAWKFFNMCKASGKTDEELKNIAFEVEILNRLDDKAFLVVDGTLVFLGSSSAAKVTASFFPM
jgi:hypothetical protein